MTYDSAINSGNLTINAAIIALGIAPDIVSCPLVGGNGVCGGSFVVDNVNRGNGIGTLTEVGTVAQVHHGATGEEWSISDTSGQSSRPYSGYHYTQQFQNLQSALSGVTVVSLSSAGTSSNGTWHVVSTSTGS
jgi:hypothetical protein